MEEDRLNIDLTLATAKDMVTELKKRDCAAVVVLWQVKDGEYHPCFELPKPKDSERRVVGDPHCSMNPGLKAMFLCDGIQTCLTELADIMPKKNGDVAFAFDLANLSELVEVVKARLSRGMAITLGRYSRRRRRGPHESDE